MDNLTVQLYKYIKENYEQYCWTTEDAALTEVYLGSVEESYLIINKNDDEQSVIIERYIFDSDEQDVRADLEFMLDSDEGKALDDLIGFVLGKLKDPAFVKQQDDNFDKLAANSTELINKYFS